jgi:hypothetical protein
VKTETFLAIADVFVASDFLSVFVHFEEESDCFTSFAMLALFHHLGEFFFGVKKNARTPEFALVHNRNAIGCDLELMFAQPHFLFGRNICMLMHTRT